MNLEHVRFSGTTSDSPGSVSPQGVSTDLRPAQPLALPAATGLSAVVLERAGLDPLLYREAPLTRRTAACLRMLRSANESDAMARVMAFPELTPHVLSTLLIGFSDFFRDADVFQTLERTVIARWLAAARPPRVLSVGCSSGQELYSVAMLLAEHGLLGEAELVGIDCRADAIRSADEGRFQTASLAELPSTFQSRYFTPAPGGVRVKESLRSRTRWHVMDATAQLPAGPWDLVMCRNLFIYLRPPTIDAMLTRMIAQLAPDGFLVVGKAERPLVTLGLKSLGRCVYSRHAL